MLAVYSANRADVTALGKIFGGKIRAIAAEESLSPRATPPTRIGRKLEIIHESLPRQGRSPACLCVPHGVAFGSGEHATTFMLLRALTAADDWKGTTVLDLGTGSGVLALAARHFGARKITATDFDPDAVRTARENEALNFSAPLIRWRRADVRRLRAKSTYDLVLANLFSGILVEAAPQITGSVASSGQLWLSGILHSQQKEVVAAYRAEGLKLKRTIHRGKWLLLQWKKAGDR